MSGTASALWPACIIHVNEDGWVLINRGTRHGVAAGLRLLVVASGTRELLDLYRAQDTAPLSALATDEDVGGPVVLRLRRTFELLEVIYAARDCAVAVAARVPVERRPAVYAGSEGEVMVWVPLAPDYVYPHQSAADGADDDTDDTEPSDEGDANETPLDTEPATADPEGSANQQDDLWEQALPLNGVNVGDLVMPALPATSASSQNQGNLSTGTSGGTSLSAGGGYDWMKL